jgi:hypothetical protein
MQPQPSAARHSYDKTDTRSRPLVYDELREFVANVMTTALVPVKDVLFDALRSLSPNFMASRCGLKFTTETATR